ncbi:MAG TPA: lytic transglycosylase domain-containing protein [Candidatus Poseidoniales archaeon]|nr:lytic transglycosylase domain-containing protein [Candidatus Poseidoniales archaeon]
MIMALDAAVFLWWRAERHDRSFDVEIRQAAASNGIAPALIKAVAWRESRFNPDARGASGEYGLMQIQETAAREWAAAVSNTSFEPEDLLDPKTNLMAGSWYLKKWSDRAPHADNPFPFALAAYNAGPSKAREWAKDTNSSVEFIEQIGYQATRDYVLSVQEKAGRYRESFSKKSRVNPP